MTKAGKIRRVGILTGGGDCPGLNAVIRAAVKSAIHRFGIETLGIADGYDGLVQNKIYPLSWDDVSGILTAGGTILGTSNTANPFQYYAPTRGDSEATDRSDDCIQNCKNAELDALICIGGDGTLSIAHRLGNLGIPTIGVPKTIDNDVQETDYTFGFDTAMQIVADAVDRLHTTAQSHHRVMVIETMGRYTGWLALMGGLAGGGDIILIPEIEYRLEHVCDAIEKRNEQGRRFSIVVVSEGVKTPEGKYVERDRVNTSYDRTRLGGIGTWLAKAIEDSTGKEARCVTLGHLQRGGTPTARDRVLATQFGYEAIAAAARGEFGTMVALKGTRIETVPLHKVAGQQRKIAPTHPLLATARAVGTSFGNHPA
jgi:6-phosphofructokinase 1